ncbi:MAG: DoxX family protein [Gemmatimonadales bacterium]|jgi:uncharacterized membrane protein YphA (DoxX/SURF4 family)|nr:DoxX family protein [Gemmatimonadales bacterium]
MHARNGDVAARGLAVLRVLVGLWFAKALWTKLGFTVLGFLPGASTRWIETMPKIIGRQMAENPIGWYKAFVEGTVLPNAPLFAHLTALGEIVAGVSLVLGLFTGVGALLALFLSLNYGLATWHLSPASEGFHWTLVSVMLALLIGRAGKTWGLDGWLVDRKEAWWGSRRPWS